MNAHNQLWGSTRRNPKGKIIEELLLSHNISILNDGTPTHYHIQNGTLSTIDLSICSSEVFPNFKYSTLSDLHGSDHFPIILELQNQNVQLDSHIRFKTEKADWQTYYEMTNMQIFEGNLPTLEIQLNEIEDKIITAATACMPMTSGKRNKPSKPWWNNECRDAVKERKRALDSVRRTPSRGNIIRYQRAKAQCRYTCKQARTESLKQFISTLTTKTPIKKVFKKVNKLNNSNTQAPIISLQNGNDITSNPAEVGEILANNFASVSAESGYSLEFQRYKLTQERRKINFKTNSNFSYNDPISKKEFEHCLSLTKESSAGIDQITYSMIKKSHPSLQKNIMTLFNHIFLEECFPDKWRTSIIIPILKPNKNATLPSSYRPIALTSCLCKLLEKILNIRLMWYLETHNVITQQQSGFRCNRGTTDQLVMLSNDLQTAKDNKEHSIVVFFDVNKAYDTAWKFKIIENLHEYGLRGSLPTFIQNFLQNRKIVVRIGNHTSTIHQVQNGIPQGSVLSCTCFLIAMNTITKYLPHHLKSTLYVDDYAIYTSGKCSNRIERRIQLGIDKLKEWSNHTGFTMSPSKTKSMHICSVRRCTRIPPDLKLDNIAIEAKSEYKFLGVFFDEKLNWKSHITQLRNKCIKKLNLLKLSTFTT